MKRSLSLGLVLTMVVLAAGCLEFKRQTVSYRHDPESDTLRIYQDYQGIFGADNVHELSEQEIGQMKSVMEGERTFLFGNWITEYNRKAMEEIRDKPAGELSEIPAYEKAIRDVADSTLKNIKVENAGFYYNQSGQLCGAQRVTIDNVSKVLADLNEVLLFVARQEGQNPDKTLEEQRLLVSFADNKKKVFQLQGNRVIIQWPVPESEFRRFKEQTVQGATFMESGGLVEYRDGVIRLSLGKPEARMVSLSLPVFDHPYVDNAIPEAKKYGIKDSFDAVQAAREFLLP